APGNVRAVPAKKRDAGGQPDQCPRRDQNLERDDEAEQRHGGGGAEAGRAAQRIGDDHHRAAIGDLEGREELDGGTPLSPRPGGFYLDSTGWGRLPRPP